MRKMKVLLGATILIFGVVASGIAADPVTITITPTSAGPGATATAKAVITINDGSTLQGLKWTRTSGVAATLTNDTTDTVSVALPSASVFKQALIAAVDEPPIADDKLPPNIPPTSGYEASVQNRFGVIGLVPHAIGVAKGIGLDLAVTTSSGTYHKTATLTATLPWDVSPGVRTVALNLPVLLHGKAATTQTQATWDWVMTPPSGSKAVLNDATSQWPDFTPDVVGDYLFTVTDVDAKKSVTLTVHAGTWRGIIVGQDAAGLPTPDPQCMVCHVQNTPNFDLFTPWKKTGHAAVFSDNVKDNSPTAHYAASCLGCHTVGYNGAVKNGGIDDAPDFQGLLSSGMIGHGDPTNWTKILSSYPAAARLTNIQCENCHGPQGPDPSSPGHMNGMFKDEGARISLQSNVCGSCHGEPARHGRFQQWQLSRHSNYETAMGEGTNSGCTKCHSAQGFLAWEKNGFSSAAIAVTWTTEEVQPATCVTCHDPHDVGTTTGLTTNAPMRIMNNTPMLDAGFKATNVGTAALCMSCHNSRRGLRNDSIALTSNFSRAPHAGPQADIVMGQNLYFTKTGNAGYHGMIQDSCVNCHMENSLAPTGLYSASSPGANHTFFASTNMCSKCHTEITADDVQQRVETKLASLKGALENALKVTMQTQIRLGNKIDVGGLKTLTAVSDFRAVEFTESHGAAALAITLSNGTQLAATSLGSINVLRPGGSKAELLAVADPNLAKAGWNYFMIESDKSKGVHNPAFVNSALDVSVFAANAAAANVVSPTTPSAGLGGGLGNGAGAVACTTPYVYWAEIAGHAPGNAGSQWRTDLIARNLSSAGANLKFYLHQTSAADLQGTGVVLAGGQNAFEDIVGMMGGTSNIGSLEICSDQPLLVSGRIFNQATQGTFGQNLEGRVADLGFDAGDTVNLIGLRQQSNLYRTNLSVTNGGTTEAQVAINLFDSTGKSLTTYNLTIPAGRVVQDTEPFAYRAGVPDIGWGYATVTVLKGTNVLTSASMIDYKTNDPTTILPKQ